MNKIIKLITGNQRKVESLQTAVSDFGYIVQMINLNPPEIQARTTAEVASFSARWAANEICQTCVKMDSGLFVKELNNFPGVYVRWVDEGLGAERFFDITSKLKNTEAYIECSVAYCESGKDPIVFSGRAEGYISKVLGEEGSFIDRLFVPLINNADGLTLGELRKANPEVVAEIWGEAERNFVNWLSKNNPKNNS